MLCQVQLTIRKYNFGKLQQKRLTSASSGVSVGAGVTRATLMPMPRSPNSSCRPSDSTCSAILEALKPASPTCGLKATCGVVVGDRKAGEG